MSNYRAIVFDIDGTAIPNRPDGMPSPRLIDTIARHRDRLHLIAATGRPLKSALPVFDALGITELCAVSGGTIIVHPATREIIRHTALPRPSLEQIMELAFHHHYPFFLREEQLSHKSLPLASDIEVAVIGQVPRTAVPGILKNISDIPHVAATAGTDWSGNGYAIIITHENATKEHATADILERLGIAASEAIGIGDGNIDLHLFRSVGLKIAMGNASPELKAAADHIAPSIDEDGLAQIIERYAAALSAGPHLN